MSKLINQYDVAVIGGGPAGMMAAGRAGELGARVILLEKNFKLGIKLLSTGGSRCNLSNGKENKALAENFGSNGRWLLSGLSKFNSADMVDFFNKRGLTTKIEDNDRLFPNSNSAQDVLSVLINYLQTSNVTIKLQAAVKNIVKTKNKINKIILQDGTEIFADNFIICTGGKSYPATGSTGDAYLWLKNLGHQIIAPRPALAPLLIKDNFIPTLQGSSFTGVKITCWQKDKKICSGFGPLLFTAQGVSGPTILNLSGTIAQTNLKDLYLSLDFFPDLSFNQLDLKFREDLISGNKLVRNALSRLMPLKFIDILLNLTEIEGSRKINSINRAERLHLVNALKDFKLQVAGVADYNQAMITAGGVDLREVDNKTMRSKIINNLYLAGEILDLNGPTGGYNLQMCWTSAYVAGEAAASTKN